jgi:murein DD-endopeptidase MepM/ murein hydrolase activator NlpD
MIRNLLVACVAVGACRAVAWEREVQTVTLRSGQTLAEVLYQSGIPAPDVQSTLDALHEAHVLDFARVRSGSSLRIETEGSRLRFFELHDGPANEWCVRREGERFEGFKRDIPIHKNVVSIEAVIQSSLFQAFVDAGQDPQLAPLIADVFAWDIDFYVDPRPGDRIRAVVERIEADGRLLGYGEVQAAEYLGGPHSAIGDRSVFRYVDREGSVGYYDATGQSARRTFLKSPLKFAHVTSGYGMRVHPLLGYRKEHAGVDYAAAVGTPVWAVGDGAIEAAGYKGSNGNYVAIKHRNGLETFYCHLSRIAEGIHTGARVLQKRVIGFVGATGLATGPHLHYALKKGGQFMNPLALKVPRAEPISPRELPDFRAAVDPLLVLLHGPPPVADKPASVAQSL